MNATRVALALMSFVAISVAGCARIEEGPSRPEHITDFNVLYAANCSGCHGADGRRGVAQPLNDAAYLAFIGSDRLRQVIAGGVPGTAMTAFAIDAGGTLTRDQIRAVADGMRQAWGSTAALTADSVHPYNAGDAIAGGVGRGDAARGGDAFRLFCARCHGADGRGGAAAGSVVDAAFLALTSDQSLRTTVINGRADEKVPGWRDYVPGRPMSAQDIADVVAWLASHREESHE